MEVWAPCYVPMQEAVAIPLTTASQLLLRDRAIMDSNPPSPMTVDEEMDDLEDFDESGPISADPTGAPCHTIQLDQLDLSLDEHRRFPVPNGREAAFEWTERQRALAENAAQPEMLDELREKVSMSS